MGCRQDRHICNSQEQETGLATSPHMNYVIVYPVRNAWRVDPQGVYKHESYTDSPPSLLNKWLQNNEKSPLLPTSPLQNAGQSVAVFVASLQCGCDLEVDVVGGDGLAILVPCDLRRGSAADGTHHRHACLSDRNVLDCFQERCNKRNLLWRKKIWHLSQMKKCVLSKY